MYEIEFSKEAAKHVLLLRKSSPQLFKKLERLLDELKEHYYEADAEGTEGEEGADAANSMVDEEEPENGTVPAEEPVEAEEKQGSAGDDVNPSQADGVVYLG